ncbi:unnamed protein product [Mortierella alpina]
MNISRLNWLRLFIVCLSLVSLILGIALRTKTGLYYDLIIIIVSDALAIILYVMALRRSKEDYHYRLLGIGLRIAMSIFALFLPAKVLKDCSYGVEPSWSESRGPFSSEYIRCPGLSINTHLLGEPLRPTYDLLRALIIVALIASLLMVVELFSYWWSYEGSGRASHEVGMELAAPIEMDLETIGSSDQKIEMPDR